ncbi:MAG TPA: universal stress protein [Salinimicrobium sp.]|nr:universal stress protein [Salinimicrobium sp.]
MKNILVAVNFEKNAGRLLEKATEFAQAFNCKIWILHVSEPETEDYLAQEAGPQFARKERREKREKEAVLVKKLEEELLSKGFDAEGLIIEGPTSKTIRKKASELNIDMVIAGHHKRNFFYQIFVGSTEQELIEENLPVLIIPLN